MYPKLTVVEIIDLFRSFYATSRPTDELIDMLELGEKRNARTKDLSGGQRQRLAVALALVNDPELIFLDEPTTGLDPAARRSLWDLIRGLKAQGRSVLLTTHYMEEAEVLCDRLAIMDHGRILEMGTVDELISKRFKERAVRFDAIDGSTTPSLERLPAVTSVKHDEDAILLYSQRRRGDRRRGAGPDRGARHRAAEPRDPAGDARGCLPRPDRSSAARLRRPIRCRHSSR